MLGIIAIAGMEQNLTDNGSLWVYCFFIGAVRVALHENTSKCCSWSFWMIAGTSQPGHGRDVLPQRQRLDNHLPLPVDPGESL